ncbi:MAG: response regulator transcription factor [Candidatus Rokubacteria bacterium]|nr:response regulator transcription factor [Candidatus Rokubacteria bacterium]
MTRIRIAIVEDHEIVRAGLRATLGAESDMLVVGDARTGDEGVKLAERLHPDVMLLDIRLDDVEGPEVCRRALAVSPKTAVIMLTSYSQETLLVRSLAAGAKGYLVKDVEVSELKRTIRLVYRGNSVLDPKVTAHAVATLVSGVAPRETVAARAASLSPTDVAIVRAVSEGLTNKEIALRVNLSPHTVKDRLDKIRDMLGARSRAQIVTKALGEGVISAA